MAQPLEWTPIQPNYSMAASLLNVSEQGFSKVGDIFSKIGEQRQKQQELQMRAAEAQAMNQFRMQQLQQAQEQFNIDKQFERDKLAYAEQQRLKEASTMADILSRFRGTDYNKYNEQMNAEINNNEQLKAINKEIGLLNQQNVSNASIIADADKARKRLIYTPEDAKEEQRLLQDSLSDVNMTSGSWGVWNAPEEDRGKLAKIQSKLRLNQDGTIDTSKGVNQDVLNQYNTITDITDKYTQQTQANNERLSLLNQTAKTIVGNIRDKYKDKLANSDPFIDQEYVKDSNGTILRDEQGKPITRSIPNAAKRLNYIRQKFAEAGLIFDPKNSLEAQMLLNAQLASYERDKASAVANAGLQKDLFLKNVEHSYKNQEKNNKPIHQYLGNEGNVDENHMAAIDDAGYKIRDHFKSLGFKELNNEAIGNAYKNILTRKTIPGLGRGNLELSDRSAGPGPDITPDRLKYYVDRVLKTKNKDDARNLVKLLEMTNNEEDALMASFLRFFMR